MAFDKKSIRVLAGGLNLAVPGDVLQDDESQELLNFSTDSQGSLRSRRGHAVRCTTSPAVSMIRGLGNLWVGSGAGLGPSCGSVLSGGDPLGLMSWKDFVWTTGGGMRKSDGGSDWRWIPQAPEDKPTAKPTGSVETIVVDFSGGFTVDPAGDEAYNPGLQITASEDGISYDAVKDIDVDLGTNKSLDEVHKITVYSKNWDRIKEVIFEVDCNAGDFTTDYFSARMRRKNILGGLKEEVTFYIRARPLEVDAGAKDKKRYGSFERIGSTPEKGWDTCVKARVKVTFIETTRIRFVSWVAVGDLDNTLEGDNLQVCYTYTTDADHESNPSEFSDPCTANRTGITVEGMLPSSDPQVTGMHVYLKGSTLGGVYRVTEDAIPQASTYTITKSFNDLTNLGVQLENDHDDPPAAEGLIGPYFGRAIAWKGNRFYWSHVSKPYAFAQPDGEFGDWQSVEEGLGNIRAATMLPGVLFFYCDNGVAVLQGDPGGPASALHRASPQSGIRSQQGIVQTPEGDYGNFSEGIWRFNGSSIVEISRKIQPVFKSGWNAENAAMGYRNGVVYCSDGAQTYRWDSGTDRWFEDSRLFTAFYSDGGSLLGGMTNGQVVELESGFFDDAGAPFNVLWLSKFYDCGSLDLEKTFEDLTIYADTGGNDLTVTALLENGSISVPLGTINSTSKQRFVLQLNDALGVKARNLAIRIAGSVRFECVINEVVINFYIEAREARSFDSDETDHGTRKVKELMEIQIDLDSPAAAQLILQSDQPGFAMSTRDSSHSFPVSSTRRQEMYVLSESILGHNLRYVLDGADFRVYGMRALLQVIGSYYHGSRGERYRSDPIGFGDERVKLYKEIHVCYASDGAATILVSTELPDGSIQEVTPVPATLTSTGGLRFNKLQTRKIRLPGTAKGRLIQIEIRPEGDLRLESVKVFLKMIGGPNASGWGFADLPLEKTQPAIWSDVSLPPDSMSG